MKPAFADVFQRAGLVYAEAIPFSVCRTINGAKLHTLSFAPQTALMMAVPFFVDLPADANLSLYAMAEDYHLFFRELSRGLIQKLSALAPTAQFAAFADASPIDERDAALRAGLGVLGRHGLVITEKYASFVFLGEILTDLAFEEIGDRAPTEPRLCEGCGACLAACPKKDLCLSALTQKKGELSAEEAAEIRALGSAWGCDLCQLACPHTACAEETPFSFFRENRITHLDREAVAAMPNALFKRRAFAWRGRATLLRNLTLLAAPGTEQTPLPTEKEL